MEDPHIAEYVLNSQLAQFSLSTVTACTVSCTSRPFVLETQVAWENSRHFVTLPVVSREMTFEKRAQKFHTDDASLPTSDWMRQISSQSPVWNFCARFSDVIWRTNHRWRRQMSGRFRKLINVDLVTFLFCFVIIYVCMQFTLKDFLNRLFPVIKAAIYTFF